MLNKYFECLADEAQVDPLSEDFANYLDDQDPIKNYRSRFNFPKSKNNKKCLYFNGNSLGLMPRDAKFAVNDQLDKWANRGGAGHVEEPLPWLTCDEYLLEDMSEIVGANKEEIALMNQLSVNLHLMLVSFYRPTKDRYRILCEDKAFPSDHYIFQSQIEWHGYNSKDALITMKCRENENTWRNEDILKFIETNGKEIALICFSGVHFLSGQCFNIKEITEVGHKMGCVVGWDLAHAVGNIPLELHQWNVDFAVWCSYKYLNSGPGGLGGIFVHESNLKNDILPYFKGWWGHRSSDRLDMTNEFMPAEGALKYRISNTSFTSCVLLQTSLKIFKEIGMKTLREKSIKLTNYFQFLMNRKTSEKLFKIITPAISSQRGAQLSIQILTDIENLTKYMEDNNIFCDCRHSSILRLAPCPLYNSFNDVYNIVKALENLKPTENGRFDK